jgi:two-component system chemotaxis response regulator CheY
MSKTILIVDDSTDIRQFLKATLVQAGFKVIEANDGAQGLSQIQANPIDLIITDVNMPNMDGLTMLSELRKLPAYARTPAFVLTVEANPDMVAKGKSAGATAWIVKPFKPEVLLKGVQKVLGV